MDDDMARRLSEVTTFRNLKRLSVTHIVLRRPAIDTANTFAEIDGLTAGLTDLEQRR
jgi:hypothetical protein